MAQKRDGEAEVSILKDMGQSCRVVAWKRGSNRGGMAELCALQKITILIVEPCR